MIRRSITLLTSLLFLFPAVAVAQDDEEAPPPSADVVQIGYFKCDLGAVGQIIEVTNEKLIPIAQESIDAGHWMYFQLLTHSWGDEWNVNFYMRAPSIDSFHEGFQQYVSAIAERHPDLIPWFQEVCSEHKDNMYQSTASTGM